MEATTPLMRPAPELAGQPDAHDAHGVSRLDVLRVALVGCAALATGLLPSDAALRMTFGAVVIALGAWPIIREAAASLLQRRMTMELSMTIALVAALAIDEVFVALMIAVFVLAAEILEELTVARGRLAIDDLLRYLPRTASVRRGEAVHEVAVEELVPGDLVLINPGSAIAVDGTVVSGASVVDEATITGEPMPAAKAAGDTVYAGTTNHAGALEVRASRVGRDSTFGKIVEAVERAEHSRAPVQRLADRLSGYLVYIALTAAAVTFAVTGDMRATISVVIVAGSCGIAAGTPLAILGGIGQAARNGSIIKGGLYLEILSRVDTVVLDKTGTLTYGTPAVQAVIPLPGATEADVLAAAALAEARSEHPLARAVLEHARERGVTSAEPEHFGYTPGGGVVAVHGGVETLVGTRAFVAQQGTDTDTLPHPVDGTASEVVVARGGRLLGSILVADALRAEAVDAIAAIRAMGIRTVLLSGDREVAAEAAARRLGVDEFAGALLPHDKLERVRALVASGRTVAMVGDGINDAPALAQASVGVAMGSGTDVTRESAQVVLIGNDLGKFVDTLRVSHRTRRVIVQNFAGTLGLDALGMALAALGVLGPLLAAVIHVASELAFILNSARLLPRRGGR